MDRKHAITQSRIDVSRYKFIMILLTVILLASCAPKAGIMTAQVQVPGSEGGNVSYDGAATSPSSPSVSGAYTCIDTRTPCLGSTSSPSGIPMLLAVSLAPAAGNMVSRLIEFRNLQPGLWSLRATIPTMENRKINFCNIPVEADSETAVTIFMHNTPPNAAYKVNNGLATSIQPCQ